MTIASSRSASATPARSQTASRPWRAPRSAASTTPTPSLKASAAGRRPPLDGPASGCSTSSPAESSTPRRCITVERERPVTSITSVRVSAWPSRMRRRTPPAVDMVRDSTAYSAELLRNYYAEVLHETHLKEIFCLPITAKFGYARASSRKSRRRVEWLGHCCSTDHAHCGCRTRTPRASGPARSASARWSAASATAPSSTSTAAPPPSPTACSTATCAPSCAPIRPARRTPPRWATSSSAPSTRSAPRFASSSPATSSTSAHRTATRRCSTWTWPPPRPTRRSSSRRAGRSSAGCS